ncbi:IclR family transcriptional regulator [Thermovorax subterraneus]|nr:IclR family transcriptional regulator [Thermovorax subterraneus]
MQDGIQSVKRALFIMEKLAASEKGCSAVEIAKELGVNRSTAFRLVETLVDMGYVRQDEFTKRYHLTMKVFSLGNMLLERMDIRSASKDILEDLNKKSGHTVHLGLRDGYEVVYIDKLAGKNTIQMYSMIGKRAPLYCTGLGKAILAFLKDHEIDEFLGTVKLKKFTANTITEPSLLRKEIEKIRRRGYALDLEEHEEGIRCVGAPIFNCYNEVIGSISVAAVAITLGKKSIEDYSEEVVKAAKKISSSLGATI